MSDAETLFCLLNELAEIGRPRLSKMKGGNWHAVIEFPAPAGVTAEVKSDFNHKTPSEALQCVHDRIGGLKSMLSIQTPQPGIGHRQVDQ